jgi:hypothetical protein
MGRVRTSTRQREALMDEFERSGVSGPKFAETVGICYQTFAGWMQRRRRERGDYASAAKSAARSDLADPPLLRWVEADVEGESAAPEPEVPPAACLSVELASGVCVRINNPSQIPLAVELARQLSARL